MNTLSLITFIPLLGAIIVLFLPKDRVRAIQTTAIAAASVSFILSVALFFFFDRATPGMQFVEHADWIPSMGISYFLGVDGLSYPLLVLTTLMTLVGLIGSLGVKNRVKEYFFWFLLLDVGMLGVFEALDLVLFYVFWELCLVPMYFLIGIWGGPKKEYAAIKFFLYTLAGSVFMLLAILAVYFNSTPHTFDILALMKAHSAWSLRFQILVFLGFYLAFAIKVPAFPFHTWLPLAHVEAPTAVSVILAAVLLKMGVYGILRISYGMLPLAFHWFLPYLVVIAVVNIVYGSLCAMAQTDMKKMVAYSSVNHMGYCLLGIAGLSATGFSGAVFQMIAHGIITGALFLLVGVIYDRAHTRDIAAFGGLAAKVPVYGAFMFLLCFASLGLPGLAGFVGEFLCFLGAFARWKVYTAVAVLGVLATAAFFLRMLQKVFLGPLNAKWAELPDMTARELISIAPLAALSVIIGVWPGWVLNLMNATILHMTAFVKP
ncbi:MAG: NADH-quinone oxidoreductase subunit M [Elusimicrobia bacterium]|nr:NADH-quinone oxidoreductase subunit M [Elusimicrobiota bacterium]MDE2236593.1 NADH-quinone oxidoreductase subunit M [Elusimicrobiota bacterium]MDE2425451.1 NADH-quinone oxidoreductase subunit M [Elusimicrobiota bacterium]